MTLTLILTCVVTYLFQVVLPAPAESAFVASFSLIPARLFHPGDYPNAAFGPVALPLVTHMFLHAGLLHLGFNMLFLWIFGDNVEDLLGHGRFLLFYLACGLVAVMAHVATAPGSPVPLVGASGAIAGVLGAYFLSFPKSTVTTLVPLFGFLPVRLPLPSVLFLGLWFLMQLKYGVLLMGAAGGVAWWAHVGGFVAGMVLLRSFRPRRRVVIHPPTRLRQ